MSLQLPWRLHFQIDVRVYLPTRDARLCQCVCLSYKFSMKEWLHVPWGAEDEPDYSDPALAAQPLQDWTDWPQTHISDLRIEKAGHFAANSINSALNTIKSKPLLTGSCACIDWNCGGDKTPAAAKYSSSVLIVPRERLICAGSDILWGVGGTGWG
jgi:hypothetical protein